MDRNILWDQHYYLDASTIPYIFGVFIMLNMYMRKIMIKRMGGQGGGAMFGSTFGGSQNSSSLKYYCMSCGTQHRQIACPNCGSKMKRVGS
ncbi:MAG: hypothetical protein WA220_06070 [Candidatus Nitrosopolaris sp.]